MKKRVFLCISIALMVLFCGTGIAAEPEGADQIVAKVGDEIITQSDIDSLLDNLDPQTAAMYRTPQGRAAVIDDLVNSRLFAIKGLAEGIDKSPEYIGEVERFKMHALMKVVIDRMFAQIKVTEEDTKKFYDNNPSEFSQAEQVNASHILVSDDVEMEKVLAELKAGEKFEDVAKKYSTCPSKENGGNLGFFGRGQMVPEFEKVAFESEVGIVSAPVKTQFGLHVVKVEARKEETKVPYEEVAEQINAYLLRQKRQEVFNEEIAQLKAKHKVELMDPVSKDK